MGITPTRKQQPRSGAQQAALAKQGPLYLPNTAVDHPAPCMTFRRVALDSHPFFPSHVASGHCILFLGPVEPPRLLVDAHSPLPTIAASPPMASTLLPAGGGVGTRPPYLVVLPLAAPIGLSPLLILTLWGPERVLVVSTEPPDDLSCLTTPGVGHPGDGPLPVPLTRGIQTHTPSPCGGLPTPALTCAGAAAGVVSAFAEPNGWCAQLAGAKGTGPWVPK